MKAELIVGSITLSHISAARDTDNRDKDETIAVLEARVEALLKRVHELEEQLREKTSEEKH